MNTSQILSAIVTLVVTIGVPFALNMLASYLKVSTQNADYVKLQSAIQAAAGAAFSHLLKIDTSTGPVIPAAAIQVGTDFMTQFSQDVIAKNGLATADVSKLVESELARLVSNSTDSIGPAPVAPVVATK